MGLQELTYSFDGREDAGRYLREVGVLWTGWLAGLAGVLLTSATLLIIWGITALIVLIILARPLQRRAERLVPENKVEGGKLDTALRGGTTRDRALRDLAYGTEPLRVALQTVGRSERWMIIRHIIVALTVLALIYVIANPGI